MDLKNQIERSFSDKWNKNPDLAIDVTLNKSEISDWILSRNGFKDFEHFGDHISKRKRILDAGCGNGRITLLLSTLANSEASVTGIDLTSHDVAKKNVSELKNVSIYQKDLLEDLSDLGSFDFIYCQEVLHHTSDPLRAFKNLLSILEPGGEIAIYLYKKKAPLREYADDYVRDRIKWLSYEQSLEAMKEITEFGRYFSSLEIEVDVPPVEILGIKGGKVPLQRFMYDTFFKCFWNDKLSFSENEVINYDWYHPSLCSRHTIEEVEGWFNDSGLETIHICEDNYGITARGLSV